MKNTLIAIVLLTFPFKTIGQDLQKYINTLEDIVERVPTQIYQKDNCDALIDVLDDLSDDLEELLRDTGEMHPEDVKNLKSTLKYAGALENFLRTIGNSSYIAWYLKDSEIRLVSELIELQIIEIQSGKFCVDIYQLSLGNYICLLAYKKGGNDILNIKAQTTSNQGKTLNKVDMGLSANQYRRFWSNGDKITLKDYDIKDIQCSIVGSNTFGF